MLNPSATVSGQWMDALHNIKIPHCIVVVLAHRLLCSAHVTVIHWVDSLLWMWVRDVQRLVNTSLMLNLHHRWSIFSTTAKQIILSLSLPYALNVKQYKDYTESKSAVWFWSKRFLWTVLFSESKTYIAQPVLPDSHVWLLQTVLFSESKTYIAQPVMPDSHVWLLQTVLFSESKTYIAQPVLPDSHVWLLQTVLFSESKTYIAQPVMPDSHVWLLQTVLFSESKTYSVTSAAWFTKQMTLMNGSL